jgi:transposase-like protein
VKAARPKPGSTWHLDEMLVTLRGEPYLLWRAVDEYGTELDILVQKRLVVISCRSNTAILHLRSLISSIFKSIM